jgi:hypothetical protein
MGFPTVKSSPWQVKYRKTRPRFLLWPPQFWKDLCARALLDDGLDRCAPHEVSAACAEMIGDMNERLYGAR